MNNRYVSQILGLTFGGEKSGKALKTREIKYGNRLEGVWGLESDLSLGSEDLPYDILSVYAQQSGISEMGLINWAKASGVLSSSAESIHDIEEDVVLYFVKSWGSISKIIERQEGVVC